MSRVAVVAILVPIYKIALNVTRYLRTMSLYRKYLRRNLAGENFLLYQSEVMAILSRAGINNTRFPTVKEMDGDGLFQMVENVHFFDAISGNDYRVEEHATQCFQIAAGEYRRRAIDAVNPFFWIERIVYLPKFLLRYLGASPSTMSFKLLNAILTTLYWVGTLVLTVFRNNIKLAVISFFEQVF